MGKTKGTRRDQDTPWKDILEHFFPEFMEFFFPQAYEEIDWRGITFSTRNSGKSTARRSLDAASRTNWFRHDERAGWRPTEFGHELFGCRVGIRFVTAKVLDYAARLDELERSANPFAAVALAHLKTQATKKDDTLRLKWKIDLVKSLHERGLMTLKIRFGNVSASIAKTIKGVSDPDVLKNLHEKALTTDSPTAFRAALKACSSN